MITAYITSQPVALPFVAETISQLREQDWVTEHVLYAGIMQARIQRMDIPNQLPAYSILACKEFIDKESVVYPKVEIGGNDISMN